MFNEHRTSHVDGFYAYIEFIITHTDKLNDHLQTIRKFTLLLHETNVTTFWTKSDFLRSLREISRNYVKHCHGLPIKVKT